MPEYKLKVGRPPQSEPKAQDYKISMTPAQMTEIDQAAAALKMGRSQYFRSLHKERKGISMKREEAVRNAIKAVEQEGFVFTVEEKAVFERVAKGEISCSQFREQYLTRLEKLKKEHPEMFREG
jgi:hypothetical protein